MFYSLEETQKMTKTTSDAFIKSFSAFVEGAQTMSNEVIDYSKKTFEQNTAAFEKMIGAKTIEKAVEIQNAHAKSAYTDYVAGVTKMSEIAAEAAKTAYKPVEEVVAKASNKAAPAK